MQQFDFSTPFPAVPVVLAQDVIVMEIDGVAVVTFTRTGDLGKASRFTVRLAPGSATSRKLPNIILCMSLIDARCQCNSWYHNGTHSLVPRLQCPAFFALWKNTQHVFPKCKKTLGSGAWERDYGTHAWITCDNNNISVGAGSWLTGSHARAAIVDNSHSTGCTSEHVKSLRYRHACVYRQ